MKTIIILFAVATLTGCASVGRSGFAQALHGDRVHRENDSTLCLSYLTGRGTLSNSVRGVEIQARKLDCSSVVTPQEINTERRMRKAEAAIERAKNSLEDAENAAARAEKAAKAAEQKARKLERKLEKKSSDAEWCSRGRRLYCR
jgi:hypothetical protein